MPRSPGSGADATMIISARMRMLDMIAEGSIKMITARSIVSDARSIGDPGTVLGQRRRSPAAGRGRQARCDILPLSQYNGRLRVESFFQNKRRFSPGSLYVVGESAPVNVVHYMNKEKASCNCRGMHVIWWWPWYSPKRLKRPLY